jgi:peptide/nickel transport system substrate-binding protein
MSARMPLGWGPYSIDEWAAGDHITLSRNPNYFRGAEGLPRFDRLVYRFVNSPEEALDALFVGECDYVDQTALGTSQVPRLLDAQSQNQALVDISSSGAWEQAVFGIEPFDDQRISLFASKEVRKAIGMCIDRQRIVDELLLGVPPVPDGYLPPEHPLYYAETTHYDFEPQAALELLASAGWDDYDEDPNTPLTSNGVLGVPDGTAFEFTYLVPEDEMRQAVAQIVQESLDQCGIWANIQSQDWSALLAPGPDGPVFGRAFDMAQFGWAESQVPHCFLFLSEEIPGPYPAYPKGWGGGNAAGYSNPDFDLACQTGLHSLPDFETHLQAHHQAQAIFADDLPALPLYWRLRLVAMRPDMCDISSEGIPDYRLSALEIFEYGKGCGQ